MGNIMLCSNCKKEILENSVFCNFCGNKVENHSPETQASSVQMPNQNKKILTPLFWVFALIAFIILITIWSSNSGGPPNDLIAQDHQTLMDDPNKTVQIINKSLCSNLPAEITALGITEVWVVGIQGDGPYAIRSVYAKQNGKWREILLTDECP